MLKMLNEDRLFPADPETRKVARRLFAEIEHLPLICPHGHTEPQWFSKNENFADPAQLLIVPDHYVLRMLVSQGISLDMLGVPDHTGVAKQTDGREIWRLFAENYHLFRGTPSRLWFDYTLEFLFGATDTLSAQNSDAVYDQISACLAEQSFKPRALFDRFNIEVLATTDACTDDLKAHRDIRESDWNGRVVPTYRPDAAIDPDHPDLLNNIEKMGAQTNEKVSTWQGYLNAHRARRTYFKSMGATATDHGHPSALTADLPLEDCEALYAKVLNGKTSDMDKELFRAQMLTEMAGMSVEDGLVMQLHPGSVRNHNQSVFKTFGRDKGFDIPKSVSFVDALQPLLNKYGMDKRLSLILFTLDETTYARELAPLAGAYPSLKLGPAWWFHDSPAGMMRYREMTTETAGFYNTAGFNDDTRAFPSIPARHDVARRVDCAFLAKQVTEHLIKEDDAVEIAIDLTYRLAKQAYNL
ncbi:glucuronate isomerase [Ahrensia kielensis]|uniref:Uronate isomerase n=1 Tax=Ahrensia kielensis TaxID=76980 RepID=A0ABU9T205_9HYPH